MRPATLADLAASYGVEVPALGPQPTFADFMALYGAATDVLRAPGDLRRLFVEVAEDARDHGCVWVETHVYPPLLAHRLGSPDAVFEIMLDAAGAAGAATGTGVGLVVAADRTLDAADAVAWAKRAATAAAGGGPVVAFGLANEERGFPPEPFAEAFAIAREAGLLSVPHAGELAGPESVRGALSTLQPDRLAHGVRSIEDPATVDLVRHSGVTLDLCPTSNVVLGLARGIGQHPLPLFLEAEIPVTLNADDPLMFGASILDEYELARSAMGLSDEQLAGIAATSIAASGAPTAVKAAAHAGVDAWLAAPPPVTSRP